MGRVPTRVGSDPRRSSGQWGDSWGGRRAPLGVQCPESGPPPYFERGQKQANGPRWCDFPDDPRIAGGRREGLAARSGTSRRAGRRRGSPRKARRSRRSCPSSGHRDTVVRVTTPSEPRPWIAVRHALDTDTEPDARRKLASLDRFLRLHLVAHAVVSSVFALREDVVRPLALGARGVGLGLLVLAAVAPRRADPIAIPTVAVVAIASALASWPTTSNHAFFGALAALSVAVLRSEPTLATAYLRAAVLLVTFGAGLQKALHGTWWRGSFLAWELAHDRFVRTLGRLLSEAELTRLRSLRGARDGFVLSFGPALGIAWAVVIGELTLPLLALARRTRSFAAIGLFGLGLGFELVADEVLFGGLFAAVTSLFFATEVVRTITRAVLVIYAVRAAIFVATGGIVW